MIGGMRRIAGFFLSLCQARLQQMKKICPLIIWVALPALLRARGCSCAFG